MLPVWGVQPILDALPRQGNPRTDSMEPYGGIDKPSRVARMALLCVVGLWQYIAEVDVTGNARAAREVTALDVENLIDPHIPRRELRLYTSD